MQAAARREARSGVRGRRGIGEVLSIVVDADHETTRL
jgi:hypothetical protein